MSGEHAHINEPRRQADGKLCNVKSLCDKGEGVKNPTNLADVISEQSLRQQGRGKTALALG